MNNILEKLYIDKSLWSECYIDEIYGVFTPLTTKEGELIKTGEEVYKEWLKKRKFTELN